MKKNKKIILIAVAVVIILSAAVLLSIVLIKKQPNTTNEDISETDIVTTEAEIIPDENDLSVYFGCPVENILSAFPDMVMDQNNNKYYYNDEISVNLDLDGNVLSISLEDNGEKNIFGVRCGMTEAQAKEILEKCSRYNEDPTATIAYLCDPDIKVVELWGIFGSADDPEDSFSTEGYISTDGEMNFILGGTKNELLQYFPRALAIETEHGYDYQYAGTTFYFDENGRLYKEVLSRDSKILIAGIATGMSYSEVCSSFDFPLPTDRRIEGNKMIRDDYYSGTCMIIEFADDQTVDNIVNIRQVYEMSSWLGESVDKLKFHFPTIRMHTDGYYQNEFFRFDIDENNNITKVSLLYDEWYFVYEACICIYDVYLNDNIAAALKTLNGHGFSVTQSQENQIMLDNRKGEVILIDISEDRCIKNISVCYK